MLEIVVYGGVIDWEEEDEDYMMMQKIVYGVIGFEFSLLCFELGLLFFVVLGI